MPLFAIAMMILCGAAALAVDVGVWRYDQRIAQSAADSAAIAGAGELAYPSAADVTSAAVADATANGFTDDGGTTTSVAVNTPPSSGNYSGRSNAVEVIIRKKLPIFFGNVFGLSEWMSVRAVGLLNPNGNFCVYALGGDITLYGGGGGGATVPNCGLVTNKDFVITGNANVDAQTIGYVGAGPSGGTYPLGQPMKTVPVTDPCPTIPGCAYVADLATNHPGLLHTGCQPYPAPNPLPPGEYCTQLTGTIVLQSGVFVLDQGVSSSNFTGNGVTIVNFGTGGIVINGNATFIMSPPTSGPTAGLVYYQPPGNTGPFIKNGVPADVEITGAFYAPSSNFTFNGNLPSISLLIANSISMNGGGITVPSGSGVQRTGYAVLGE
ncbi:MAG TPA: pilus assembly protein TadG-related protein [Candidatus Elarobacter sp.]|nr:pilus assembly protein TadG-related protein [Candidatus Elarobacter sp.]